MRKLSIGMLMILICGPLMAQIKFNAKISDKHFGKVERSKDTRSKLTQYKKLYTKDSIKAAKQAWKEYKLANKDSLKSVGKWREAKRHQKEILLGKYELRDPKRYFMDDSKYGPPKDSLDCAMQELGRRGDYNRLQEIYESYGQYDSSYIERFHKDPVKLDSAELISRFRIRERMESYLPRELVQESDLKIEKQMMHGELNSFGQIQQVDRSGVSEFFKNLPPEEFSKSQISLQGVKKKYASIPDLSKKEEGVKRKSLKGTPLKKRLFLNGNITFQSTDPVVVDTNIQLGYRWNKKMSIGIGLLLREQINDSNNSTITGDSHGYSFFTSYDIVKEFYVYGEYQSVINKSLLTESSQDTEWQYAYLIGVGKRFRISSKSIINISMHYDFNHQRNDLNTRPLVMRVGYKLDF